MRLLRWPLHPRRCALLQDIDALLSRGEEKTNMLKDKIETVRGGEKERRDSHSRLQHLSRSSRCRRRLLRGRRRSLRSGARSPVQQAQAVRAPPVNIAASIAAR
jgi:hypothetical protein